MKSSRKRLRKLSKWGGYGFGFLCVAMFVVSMVFSGCMNFRMSEPDIESHFRQIELDAPKYFDHETEDGTLRIAIAGDLSKPLVVFVHGSPGSWDNFLGFLSNRSLLDRYALISVDRPGFGETFPAGAEPSMEVQAHRIHAAVRASGVDAPAIYLGHSLGGPVVSRLAVDYPESVRALVLVAPSLDPDLEKRKWFNWVAKFPFIRWGLSREWRNSNDEIFPHRRELLELAELVSSIRTPVVVIQGDRDTLVPPGNADYVARSFVNAKVDIRMLEGVDHFIPWSNPEEIVKAINDLSEH